VGSIYPTRIMTGFSAGFPERLQEIRRKSKMMSANGDTETAVVSIELATITKAPEFQVRKKTDTSTVNRYAEVIKAGGELPPVRLAKVKLSENSDPLLVPVDGFHRIAAHEKLGLACIEATIADMDPVLAQWKAAEANMSHGLPLSSKEVREAFRRFIRAKQHVLGKPVHGKPRVMSYREIGARIGKPQTSIRNWMAKDFPKLFAQMGGHEFTGDKAKAGEEADAALDKADPLRLLEAALEAYRTTTDAQRRGEAIYLAERVVKQMRDAGGWVDMSPDF
jgi:uncharacterized ParB-like nuclease family protein